MLGLLLGSESGSHIPAEDMPNEHMPLTVHLSRQGLSLQKIDIKVLAVNCWFRWDADKRARQRF